MPARYLGRAAQQGLEVKYGQGRCDKGKAEVRGCSSMPARYSGASLCGSSSQSAVRLSCGCGSPSPRIRVNLLSTCRIMLSRVACSSPCAAATGLSASLRYSSTEPPCRKSRCTSHSIAGGRQSSTRPLPLAAPSSPTSELARRQNSSASCAANDSLSMSASRMVSTRLYTSTDAMRAEKAKMRSSYTAALPVPSKPSVSRKMVVTFGLDHEVSRLCTHTPLV